jgi:hypothetical protein
VLYESPILQEALPYFLNRNEIINQIHSIAKEYNVDYLQFENMEMAKSRKCYTSKLNTTLRGAKTFTDTLSKIIIQHNLLNN